MAYSSSKDKKCAALLAIITAAPSFSFLLPKVIKFIQEENAAHPDERPWTIQDFEFWLNQFSDLSPEEEHLVRGKICGKTLPRENYQLFFPIGMNKHYGGSHFIAAHLSPDIDTTVASFIVWQEAFACKVATKQHIWNLPGGAPDQPAVKLFSGLYGSGVFDVLARKEARISCVSRDLLTRTGFKTYSQDTSILTLQHTYNETAIVLVDKEGKFLGDWRTHDVEKVGQVTLLFKTVLRSFETDFLIYQLKKLAGDTIKDDIWQKELKLDDFNEEQNDILDQFLRASTSLSKGGKSTYGELFTALNLIRPTLKEGSHNPFHQLEILILDLGSELEKARNWTDTLEVALIVKEKVLGHPPHVILLDTDIEEIRLQMQDYESLTVLSGEGIPIGIIRAKDIREGPLGVVTFCDFCNYDEIKLPSFITPISVIDHHKTVLYTNSPPMVCIGDTQSCNVIVAELLFELHDTYSLRGKTKESIKAEIASLPMAEGNNQTNEKLRSLIQQDMAANRDSPYFIHPEREKWDYLLCLHAILDDTDLLTKVTWRDVECVNSLLARLETLETKKEASSLTFDNIPSGPAFAKEAAKELLALPTMKKVWEAVMLLKQQDLDENLVQFFRKKPNTLFSDTKIQNGCNLITQIKRFKESKVPENTVNLGWLAFAEAQHEKNLDVDLGLFMLSSITWFEGDQDELLMWCAPTEKGKSHLSTFIHQFFEAVEGLEYKIEIFNDKGGFIKEAFRRQGLIEFTERQTEGNSAWARMIYPAGQLNSRKSMISPYLPHLTI